MPSQRLAGLILLAFATAACPNPRNPLGPPSGPQPPASGSAIAFAIGGSGADIVRAVATDPAGSIVVAGEFTGTVDFDPSPTGTRALTSFGGTDLFVARYTALGELQWAIRAGGPSTTSVHSVAVSPAGDIVIGGSFEGIADFDPTDGVTAYTSNGGRDGFVAVYTSAGTLRWARGMGGSLDDEVLGVAVQADGTVFASGTFRGTALIDPPAELAVTSAGGVDGFLASWTSVGVIRWAFPVGGTGDDLAAAVAVAPGGGAYLGGSFAGTADFGPGTATAGLTSLGGTDVFLARYSGGGELAWVRGLHGTSNLTMSAGGLAATPNGGLAATGTFSGTADFDGTGGVRSLTSNGFTDAFVVRYEPNGNFTWAVQAGGATADEGAAVAVAPDGDVIITGSFTGTARFDPGAGATSLTALGTSGATDAFVARYSAAGSFRWVVGIGAPLAGETFTTTGTGVATDGGGHVVAGGRFFGSADVNPGTALTVLTSLGGADGFVARYTASGALATRP